MTKKEMTFLEKTKRFFSPMRESKKIYFIGIFVFFVRGFDFIVYVLFMEQSAYFIQQGHQESFYFVLVVFFFYLIAFIIFNCFFHMRGWTEIPDTAIKYLQDIYLKKYVQIDNNYTEKLGTGKAIAIVEKGLERWGVSLMQILEQGIYILISLIFTTYMVLKNSTLLFGIFILLYISIYIASHFLNAKAISYRRKRRDWSNIHMKNLVKIIMSKNEILHSGKIGHEVDNLDFIKDKEIYYNKKMSPFLTIMYELPNVLIAFLILFVLYYFGLSYFHGELALSSIFGLTAAFLVMQSSINKGVDFFKNFTKEFTDIEKMWEFFDEAPSMQGYNDGKEFLPKKGAIVLENINFGYTKDTLIFRNFSLKLAGEKITALVGPSGGGKSTLVKLIAGYIHAENGDILIDNQKISDVTLKSYYKNIGYLTQEPSVFDGTIRENLSYALEEDATEEQIQEVLESAECQFIYDLEHGIDTEIGERGVRLSGGQKQRLAIAKIFLKNPKIIILDEPTSALDSISEKKISGAMERLFQGRTVIIIAHRLQTVKHADEIIYIENGKIAERGDHKSLVKQKGLYNQMLKLQSGF